MRCFMEGYVLEETLHILSQMKPIFGEPTMAQKSILWSGKKAG